MDGRHKGVHVTSLQKRKLIQLIAEHPELIACKVTQNFNYKDSHRLWQSIAIECNALPGAKKTWKQWRKTFQDLRAKAKKQQKEMNGDLPVSAIMFTPEEQEVLGFKNIRENTQQESMEDTISSLQDDSALQGNFINTEELDEHHSDAKSPSESKVFVRRHSGRKIMPKVKNKTYSKRHSNDCLLNCDLLASQEQHKIRIKEDYLNFKKEYLKQKLKLMKQQTEALQTIARELSK